MDKQHSPTDMTLLDEMKKHYPVMDYNVETGISESKPSNTRLLFGISLGGEESEIVVVFQDHEVLAQPFTPAVIPIQPAVERLANRVRSGKLKGLRVIRRFPPLLTMEVPDGI